MGVGVALETVWHAVRAITKMRANTDKADRDDKGDRIIPVISVILVIPVFCI